MVEEEKISSNAVNTHFLIYELFDGDIDKALKVSRRFPRVNFTLTPKSVERYMILEAIETGSTDKDIIEALSTEDNKILPKRVERLRKEFENGKRN